MAGEEPDQFLSGDGTAYVYILDHKLAKRDLIWGTVVTILGIVCLGLIIGLATAGGGGESSECETCNQNVCTEPVCLGASSALARNMDTTVKPCKDFYQYACGNFKANHPISPEANARGTVHDMGMAVEVALYRYLEEPIKRTNANSYEQKLKNLFHSCRNEEETELFGGKPLIDAIEKVGGWNVFALEAGQSKNWEDYESLLRNITLELWTFPFVRFDVFPDPQNRNKRVLSVDPSGIGMATKYFLTHVSEDTQEAYKTYIRAVGAQLLMDSEMHFSPEVEAAMEKFVEDAYAVEARLAQAMVDAAAAGMPEDTTLGKLQPTNDTKFDIVGLATNLFQEGGITANSRVYARPSYVECVNTIMKDILSSVNGSTTLNNYLIWRVMDQFSQVLSREYRLAKQDYVRALTGTKEEWARWMDCVNLLKLHTSHALSAISVPEMKNNLDRQDIDDMVVYMKDALDDQMKTQSYTDAATRSEMNKKFEKFTHELYDDFDVISQPDVTDKFYEKLKVSTADIFENVLNLGAFTRGKINEILPSQTEDHPMFIWPEYSTLPHYSEIWDHMHIPLASLNYPLYHKDLPVQIKYGGLGYVMGLYAVNVINTAGSVYDSNGALRVWWTTQSYVNWDKYMRCYYTLYNQTEFGPYDVDGHSQTVKLPSTTTATLIINEIAGVRNAYKAYQRFLAGKNVKAETLSGLDLDDKQLFFLSYAHTHCVNRRDRWQYELVTDNVIPEDFRLYEALSQMPEFREAFQCCDDCEMVQKNSCTPPL